MDDLHRLRAKLCRELAQSEHDARLHPAREARRLGEVPPAEAFRAIADHAEELWPRWERLMARSGQRAGLRLGRSVGAFFSAVRHALLDRLVATQLSYRGTLLGLRHGLDVARLLREVATRERDAHLARFCDDLLAERGRLIARAEQQLAWFADEPAFALRAGGRGALRRSGAPRGPRRALAR